MARNSENIAGAISAVNNIVSTQTEALAQIKTNLARKAAGSIQVENLPLVHETVLTEGVRWIDTGKTLNVDKEIFIYARIYPHSENTTKGTFCGSFGTTDGELNPVWPWLNYLICHANDGIEIDTSYQKVFTYHTKRIADGVWNTPEAWIFNSVNPPAAAHAKIYPFAWANLGENKFKGTINRIVFGDALAATGTRYLGAGTILKVWGR